MVRKFQKLLKVSRVLKKVRESSRIFKFENSKSEKFKTDSRLCGKFQKVQEGYKSFYIKLLENYRKLYKVSKCSIKCLRNCSKKLQTFFRRF
jgi:hypothetical protein